MIAVEILEARMIRTMDDKIERLKGDNNLYREE